MMVSADTRALVWRRAQGHCEYCRVHQNDFDYFTFHVEHIIPRQHGGTDDSNNLCLACRDCNAFKGTNLTGIFKGRIVPLFHPRRQVWSRHFRWHGGILIGKSITAKVTIKVLNINEPSRVLVRKNLMAEGRFPHSEK